MKIAAILLKGCRSGFYRFLFLWNRQPSRWIRCPPLSSLLRRATKYPLSKCAQLGLSNFKPRDVALMCLSSPWLISRGTVKRLDRLSQVKKLHQQKVHLWCQLKHYRLGATGSVLIRQWDVSLLCWASRGIWVTDVNVSVRPGVIQCLSNWNKELWFLDS